MANAWTPGSVIRRVGIAGGAMLYDASLASNFEAFWFDREHWIGTGGSRGEAAGRGSTLFFEMGRVQGALRHYRRGGLLARWRGDRYRFYGESATRPMREFLLTCQLHARGLPVPAPIACRYLRVGDDYTGDLITTRIPGGAPLAARIAAGTLSLAAWIAIGRCIRSFHDEGACHADLNAHNILLTTDDRVYLIDFDRGSLRKPGWWRDNNLVRLRRSLEKISDRLPRGVFSETDWQSLLAGYRNAPERPVPQLPAAS